MKMRSEMSSALNVAMLSIHGYFDPEPQLGLTDTGGQVVYVLELSKALANMGVHVDIYTRWFDTSKPQVEHLPNTTKARVIRISAGPLQFVAKEDMYELLPEFTQNMITFIKERSIDYDLFHGHYVDGGIAAMNMSVAFKRPLFYTPHSLGEWKRERMGGDPYEMERKFRFSRRRAEELRIMDQCSMLITSTSMERVKLETLYGFPAARVEIIPPGVVLNCFAFSSKLNQDIVATLGDLGLNGSFILCLSRLDTNKGHDLLLDAFYQLTKMMPDIKLVIGGGSPNPEERELSLLLEVRGRIKAMDMQETVKLIGNVQDPVKTFLYKTARLFVLPSLFEPFGMTVLEAMACGTPVIASKFGGISDVISSGKNGILVDPTDSSAFSNAMHLVLRDHDVAQRLGAAGKETVHANHCWKKTAKRHYHLYGRYLQ